MEYRRLGRAGVKVSSIALGSWLTYSQSVGEDVTTRCVHKAYELGVNFFDTANVYNSGEAEKVVGQALKAFPRDSYVLATKVFFPMGDGPNDKGLSRKHIMEQCHASLKRLGTDYIDLYQCHRYDPETPIDEVVRALDDLVTQGKVLYVGVSEWSAAQISDAVHTARALNADPIVSNQPQYNMLNRRIENEIIPLCEREGIGQVVFSPLAQGVLTGKYRPNEQPPAGTRAANNEINYFINQLMQDRILEAVQRLKDLAAEGGYTLAQLALAWTLRQKNVSSAIIGASRPEQIEENVKASDVHLSSDVLERIDAILEGLISY
ncbi:voltage-dependent potassium channel beta subunit [Thermosporothrix hazakensis]|uniref:Voltage-dependent potassium channel beta subunit n=2 Tax=Thermosporothrix TaxID=768650 RepID=A0A326UC65_THEHA|nr:aldo/keto reductase family protein [Thermosporothrix hazakensis]PZW31292.1 voltage-dependent potassium channel beta subunit [Thermosporothrix hazakensis]BBH86475.1 voltage-gated potassium channel [Thermosporothrix sp. COM3]GCE50796.1 voltage-gated potassium channel [Thermosporothrix hazakensis]